MTEIKDEFANDKTLFFVKVFAADTGNVLL